jgi:glycine/D-amino acid oxidase-like deaminating enzyme
VVGAGIVGAACARALAQTGAKVLVLDAGAPGAATSAHCEGNLLVSDKAPGPELDLALASLAEWATLAEALPAELGPAFPDIEYRAKGGLVAVTSTEALTGLRHLATAQQAAGVDAVELAPDQWRAVEPELTDAIVGAVFYPGDAQLQPAIATQALLASARRAGAVVRGGTAVIGAATGRRGRLTGVKTAQGAIPADAVVVAAGPWSGAVARRLGGDLPVQPRRGAVLVTAPMPPRIRRKVYDGDYFAATQSADAGLRLSAVVEATAAGTVLIGSSREQVGFDPIAPPDLLAGIARRAIALFPFLAEVMLIRTYVGFRPYTPDHLPVIGPDPTRPGLWYATGHEGAGVGLAPATANLLAALMCDRPTPQAATPFARTCSG